MSTTQEVTAEQIALALGWTRVEDQYSPWRTPDGKPAIDSDFPPYLEDSPEGYATLREFEAACQERGWWWEKGREHFSSDDTICIGTGDVDSSDRIEHLAVVPFDNATINAAAWTAWYRAVQAQEQA